MLIDLHNHYPMHIHGGPGAAVPLRRWLMREVEEDLVNMISEYRNYEGPDRTPGVSMELIRKGGLDVVLSALYWPTDEIGVGILLTGEGTPPSPGAPQNLFAQMAQVEAEVGSYGREALIVTGRADLDLAHATGRTAIVHCVEGGFALGDNASKIDETVAVLADRGVAYVTVAHLFYRQIATNAPALPFMTDAQYDDHFSQPAGAGLTDLGRAVVEALLAHGIVVDVTHMSSQSLLDTLELVRDKSNGRPVPVIASHAACNLTGDTRYPEYNLTDDQIVGIAKLGGVIGLICCTHYIAPKGLKGKPQPASRAESLGRLCEHIDKIVDVLEGAGIAEPYAHIGIGSDLDGFIKPALRGFHTIDRLRFLAAPLAEKYGPEASASICGGSALSMLHSRFPESEV